MTAITQILNNTQVEKIIKRLAFEVYERNFSAKNIIIAAINGRGETVANLLMEELENISNFKLSYISIKINKEDPINNVELVKSAINLGSSHTVILVDDVLNTGKTLIYGMLPFLNFGVKSLQTLVLVDRNHNLYPVKADFIGMSLSTTLQEHVSVVVERKKINVYLK